MKAYLKSTLDTRISKLETAKQLRDRGHINPVIQWSNEEELPILLQHVREHDMSANVRGGYLVVPKIMSIDDWDAAAGPMQQRLYKAVRDQG